MKILLAIGIGASIKTNWVSSEAESVAEKSCFKGSTNGEQDAFRHIYWQCRLTQRIGADKAKKVGDINEECGGNSEETKKMDYHNNQVGRDLELNEPGCNCKTRAEEQIDLGFAMVIESVPSSCEKKDYITYGDQVYLQANDMESRWLTGGRTIERNGFGTPRPNIGVTTHNQYTLPKDAYQWTIQSIDAWSNTHRYPQAGKCLKYGDTISLQNNGRILGDANFGGNHGDNRLDNRLFPGEYLHNNRDLSSYDSSRLLSKNSKYGFYVQSWGIGILQIEQNKWSWAIKIPKHCEANTLPTTSIDLGRDREHREYIMHWCTARVFFGVNGDLVIHAGKISFRKFWSSNTQNRGATHMVLEDDGNLVIYDSSSKVLWKSGTNTFGRRLTTKSQKKNHPYIPIPISHWMRAQKIFGPYVYAVDILNDPPSEYFEKPYFSNAYLWTVKSVLYSGSHYASSDPDPAAGQCVQSLNEVYLQSNNCYTYPGKKGKATFCPWLSGNHKSYNRQYEGVGTYYYLKDKHSELLNKGVDEVQWWQIHDEEKRYKWTLQKEKGNGKTVEETCDAHNARGRWVALPAEIEDGQSVQITKGIVGTESFPPTWQKTNSWKQSVEVSVSSELRFKGAKGGVNVDWVYGVELAASIKNVVEMSDAVSMEVFSSQSTAWQFVYTFSSCRHNWFLNTSNVVFTASTNDQPCCLPGFEANANFPHGPCRQMSPCQCSDDICNSDPITEVPTVAPTTSAPSAFFFYNDSLASTMKNWNTNKGFIEWTYGWIGDWDVSKCTSFYWIFKYCSSVFNGDVTNWDVSKSTSFQNMFYNALVFNKDLSSWDVSKSNSFKTMFCYASVFNSDLGNWDVSKSTSFRNMFHKASKFNGDLSTWDVSKSDSFQNMFSHASVFESDLSSWLVSKSTSFGAMFYKASAFNGNLARWDVSECTTFSNMFNHALVFNNDLSSWNVSKSRSFHRMFRKALTFNIDLSNWDVSKSTNFNAMFSFASAFNQALCWNVFTTSNKDNMFNGLVGAKLEPYPDCILGNK
eukprot:CAMPEP_0113309126 /NCGR_PEP_ID=MMETSP0010_2-20120614/7297_1 /TAXON_ID=216773 ORGANISM="Corethron hystrix, Strain 308" /NCGR_SAMPLE_ID=MMETSP0010_2 /ASSEMBLY_ACC=CAM_ASM_000155 /LENGTH=1028 /DNA_ID=CAMNT_0000164321 /DNA_START=360 /DNA_END=3447 /DNA_ORIENTATION=+ /assembly_acc=CAM_ASM_000155